MNALNAKDASDAGSGRRLEESRQAARKGAKPEAEGPARPIGQPAQAPINIEIPTRDDGSAEKPVARRMKGKGGEKWDMASGKEAAMQVDKEGITADHEKAETEEEHEIEVELNAILKKGPSKSEAHSVVGRSLDMQCVI